MKIIKRSGSEVTFDLQKIINAINGANSEVKNGERLTERQVVYAAQNVADRCEAAGHTVSVEEIQDMVEDEIMALDRFEVARRYIIYRYVQGLKRQKNTTDDKILSLIECNNEEVKQENSNKNPTVNSVQRDYMAGEVSKDLTQRVLLPSEIVEAHNEGIIHFHDSDYFAQHMHNCDLVNLEDMLQNGTVISGTLIERPHSFSTACNIATQIIAQVASCQYGGQSISLTHLAPFVEVSRQKIRRQVDAELKELGVEAPEEKVSEVVETRLRDENPPRRPDHPVSGRHPHDHQRPGSVCNRVHVPERGPHRGREARPRHDHRGDPAPALRGREERGGGVDHARVPQAHLRA